jgi:hypothetical protein
LLKTFATWFRTVLSLIPSRAPISAFDRPWAISSRTSSSRSVSSGNGAAAGARDVAKNACSFAAIDWPKITSPSAAARIACTSSLLSASFGR